MATIRALTTFLTSRVKTPNKAAVLATTRAITAFNHRWGCILGKNENIGYLQKRDEAILKKYGFSFAGAVQLIKSKIIPQATSNLYLGGDPCLFGCQGVHSTEDFVHIDQENGQTLYLSPLSIHLVEHHQFFEGQASFYRLDPYELLLIANGSSQSLGLNQTELKESYVQQLKIDFDKTKDEWARTMIAYRLLSQGIYTEKHLKYLDRIIQFDRKATELLHYVATYGTSPSKEQNNDVKDSDCKMLAPLFRLLLLHLERSPEGESKKELVRLLKTILARIKDYHWAQHSDYVANVKKLIRISSQIPEVAKEIKDLVSSQIRFIGLKDLLELFNKYEAVCEYIINSLDPNNISTADFIALPEKHQLSMFAKLPAQKQLAMASLLLFQETEMQFPFEITENSEATLASQIVEQIVSGSICYLKHDSIEEINRVFGGIAGDRVKDFARILKLKISIISSSPGTMEAAGANCHTSRFFLLSDLKQKMIDHFTAHPENLLDHNSAEEYVNRLINRLFSSNIEEIQTDMNKRFWQLCENIKKRIKGTNKEAYLTTLIDYYSAHLPELNLLNTANTTDKALDRRKMNALILLLRSIIISDDQPPLPFYPE